ncbi:MAG TPA: hypothetical protein VM368_07500, partial [Flavisolibacter sp.]|nr:hypothetical protein [Flavisolibacter sp.]
MSKIVNATGKNFNAGALVLLFILSLTTTMVSAQVRTVTGLVRNAEDGSVLTRATVQVKGTNTITST